jgi:hypothetical protein
VDSDGHDTLLSEVSDLLSGMIWPGAYGRVVRNRLIETWTGREGQLRARRRELRRRRPARIELATPTKAWSGRVKARG